MAEFLLTFAVEQILEKVGSIAIEEIAGPFRLKKDLQNLSELTESIHGKVQKARNDAAYGKVVRPLLVKLQSELYKAEDVLDEFSYEILRRKMKIQRQPSSRICGFASPNIPILFRVKMARKVKKINHSLADIEKQGLREIVFTGKAVKDSPVVSNDQLDRVSVSFHDKTAPPVIGRTKEVKAIIDMLQASSSTPSLLTIISIVGFGGLGKTTLAKMVLDQVEERKLVDMTIWVHVSTAFDIKKIFKGMLETLDENAGGLDNLDAILRHIKKKMNDQRFLFVLDDVWEDNRKNCNDLKSHLLNICGRAGNFVIVTTRNLGVAEAFDTEEEHFVNLKELGEEECWKIIKNKCVMQWSGSLPKELEEIGVDIAKKCRGVPLVAKVDNTVGCKMHDILHDLAASISNYKTLDLKGNSTCFVRTPNHQHHPSAKEFQKGAARSVRSVISQHVGDVSHMFCIFKSLRSLDISDAGLKELPNIIGRLKHLKYLDISHNGDLEEIPESITKLYNLQTLRMMGCFGIRIEKCHDMEYLIE